MATVVQCGLPLRRIRAPTPEGKEQRRTGESPMGPRRFCPSGEHNFRRWRPLAERRRFSGCRARHTDRKRTRTYTHLDSQEELLHLGGQEDASRENHAMSDEPKSTDVIQGTLDM